MGGFAIAEKFLSFQGEGIHSGRRAYFIRLFGCNVKCGWCDSKSAWEGAASETLSAREIAGAALDSGAEIAVVTGGEPCLYDLRPLLRELSARSVSAHLETSGTLPIPEGRGANFAWVALSPKLFCPPRADSLARADELKFIISDPRELSDCERLVEGAGRAKAFWLHPEWSRSVDERLLGALCEFAVSRGGRWRVGWQVHKLYRAR